MKRGKKMVLLLGLLGVLLAGYGVIGRMNTATQVSESEGTFPVWEEGKTVASLKWESGETDFAFTMGESVWTKDHDGTFPVNQTAVQNLADEIAQLTAVRELTDVAQLSDYGLDTPAFTVTAGDADGNAVTLSLGDATPFADGYYLSVSGRDAVYVIEDNLADAFDKTLTQLATMETLPDVTAVTRMTVGDALDVKYDEATGVWRDTQTGEALDGEKVSAFADAAAGLEWSELIATSATDEELAAWQLDDAQAVRLTLYNGDTAELEILLGGQDDETDRYARLPDSRMVYTFYGSDADELLEASVDTLWQTRPVDMTAEQLGEARFVWDGGEMLLTEQDKESETAAGILEQLCTLEGTARTALGEIAAETILSVSLADSEGNAKALTFYAHDVDSYLLPITDTHGMLVPAQDVDKLIRMLRQKG